jgi:dihydroxyacetone kinase
VSLELFQVIRSLRRGLAGTILVYKIASALSDRGAELDAVEDVAKYATTRLGTLGVGLDHCNVPGTKAGESHLSADQVELGMGIHNEPGTSKIAIPKVSELVGEMLGRILDTTDADRSLSISSTMEATRSSCSSTTSARSLSSSSVGSLMRVSAGGHNLGDSD